MVVVGAGELDGVRAGVVGTAQLLHEHVRHVQRHVRLVLFRRQCQHAPLVVPQVVVTQGADEPEPHRRAHAGERPRQLDADLVREHAGVQRAAEHAEHRRLAVRHALVGLDLRVQPRHRQLVVAMRQLQRLHRRQDGHLVLPRQLLRGGPPPGAAGRLGVRAVGAQRLGIHHAAGVGVGTPVGLYIPRHELVHVVVVVVVARVAVQGDIVELLAGGLEADVDVEGALVLLGAHEHHVVHIRDVLIVDLHHVSQLDLPLPDERPPCLGRRAVIVPRLHVQHLAEGAGDGHLRQPEQHDVVHGRVEGDALRPDVGWEGGGALGGRRRRLAPRLAVALHLLQPHDDVRRAAGDELAGLHLHPQRAGGVGEGRSRGGQRLRCLGAEVLVLLVHHGGAVHPRLVGEGDLGPSGARGTPLQQRRYVVVAVVPHHGDGS